MKKSFILMLSLVLSLFLCVSSQAADFDFSGAFNVDNDVTLLGFTVGADSTITIFSSSWGNDLGGDGYVAGAGFDPILAIWDSAGNLMSEQDDGHNVGSTLSNAVAYTHGYWDSYYDVFLTAGDYTASIAQYDNFASGSTLANGFRYDGDPTFTQSYGPQAMFNGVWSDNDGRTGDWDFHILNVDAAVIVDPTIPEPGTMLLLGSGLLGLVGFRKKS